MNSDYVGMTAYERRADITKTLKAGEKIEKITTQQIREKRVSGKKKINKILQNLLHTLDGGGSYARMVAQYPS